MILSEDPIADFNRLDAKQSAWLKSLPECSICGHPIQQERAFYKDGFWICEDCYQDNMEGTLHEY